MVFFLCCQFGWMLPDRWLPGVGLLPDHLRLLATTAALGPALMLVWPRGRIVAWLLVGCCGCLCGAGFRHDLDLRPRGRLPDPWGPAQAVAWEGGALLRITGWPSPRDQDKWSAPAVLLASAAGEGGPGAGDGVLLGGQGELPDPGQLMATTVRLSQPRRAALPGGFDDAVYLAGRGLRWRGYVPRGGPSGSEGAAPSAGWAWGLGPVRRTILRRLADTLPAREASLAAAVLLGVRSAESRSASSGFLPLGLAHLFALSGLHVGILLGIALLPAKALRSGPNARLVIALILLVLYGALTGAPGSVVRAAGLAALALAAPCLGRRPAPLRHLGLLFWGAMLWNPAAVLDGGLRLSFLAAAGILTVSGLSDGFRWGLRGWRAAPAGGLSVSLAAQWFTLPAVAGSFGWINIASPLANLVMVPLFGLAVWVTVAAVLAGLAWGTAGQALAAYAFLGWRLMQVGVGPLGAALQDGMVGLPVPGPAQWAGWAVLTCGLLLLLAGRLGGGLTGSQRGILVAVSMAAGLWLMGAGGRDLAPVSGPVVWQCDVGQGDCALVVFPDRWCCLIDTGGTIGRGPGAASLVGRTLLPYLRRQRIPGLDAVALTHGHLDHTGGAADLAGALGIRTWWVAGNSARALPAGTDSASVLRPVAGEVLHRWKSWALEVWYPGPGLPQELEENDRSLVLALVRAGRTAMVWSGDLELQGEALLLASGRVRGPAMVWKAGHHGSDTSGGGTWLRALDPELVIASVGVGNRYGHPSHGPYLAHGDTLPLLRTDRDGSVLIRWADSAFPARIRCWRGTSFRELDLDRRPDRF